MSERNEESLSGRNRRRELANRRINYTQEVVDWSFIVTSSTSRPTSSDSRAETESGQDTERSSTPEGEAAADLPPLDQDEIIRFYRESLEKSKREPSRAASPQDVLTLCEYCSDEEDATNELTVRFRDITTTSISVNEARSGTSVLAPGSLTSVAGRVGTPWPRDIATVSLNEASSSTRALRPDSFTDAPGKVAPSRSHESSQRPSSRVTTAWVRNAPVSTPSITTIYLDRPSTQQTEVLASSNLPDVPHKDAALDRSGLLKRFRRFLARVMRPFCACLGRAESENN